LQIESNLNPSNSALKFYRRSDFNRRLFEGLTTVSLYSRLGSVKTHQFYWQYVSWQLVSTIQVPRRNVPDFGRVFLMLKCTDITQNTSVQSWTVTEIMARGKCGLLAGPRTVPVSWQSYPCPSLSVVSY